MIQPKKHMNLDTCLLNCVAAVLSELQSKGPVAYTALVQQLQADLGSHIRFQVPYALGLLFLLGRLDYHTESDLVYILGDTP